MVKVKFYLLFILYIYNIHKEWGINSSFQISLQNKTTTMPTVELKHENMILYKYIQIIKKELSLSGTVRFLIKIELYR